MLLKVPQIEKSTVLSVKWRGDPTEYDLELHNLGSRYNTFLIVNPYIENEKLIHFIDTIPDTEKCVVWKYQDQWVAKLFRKDWNPEIGYDEQVLSKPKYSWRKNPDLDKLMTFEDDPFGEFDPDPWDSCYKLIWYIDPKFNPLPDKVWAMTCDPIGKEVKGIKDMGYLSPLIDIEYNDELPDLGINLDDCYPAFYDLQYECAWELDNIHSPRERMWVIKFKPLYRKPREWKWYGKITPQLDITYNSKLKNLNYYIDYIIPWHDLGYEHIWMLDKKHLQNGEEDIWAFKIKLCNKTKGTKVVDYISPILDYEYNSVLPDLNYDIDYIIPWHDLGYEHIWMLDKKHLQNGEEDIWAFKIKLCNKTKGTKVVDYTSPNINYFYNSSLPELNINVEYNIPWYDLRYKHIWYLDKKYSPNEDKIWVLTANATKNYTSEKEVGYVVPQLSDRLDVIFISYHEPNAEENWQRVLEKAPWAKRIDGITGIFNAHLAAAKLATTDMFYVVDGDAWLVDDWNFNYQPSIFDRDCAYVWHSRNPINDLEYGNGGIKLFSKIMMLNVKSMTKLDMTTSVMPKLKVMEKVSNETRFNVDEFSTWRSAFRECVKLYVTNQVTKLNTWMTVSKDQQFGKYALAGAKDAESFAKENVNQCNILLNINDYNWLKERFKLNYFME